MLIVSIFVLNVLLLGFIALYCKLTCGINKCSRHLVGKVVIITGGNSGIGYETAKDLADRGARVIIACRNEERATLAKDRIIAATGNNDVHYSNLNLASFGSVRNFAKEILAAEEHLDILINNAGVIDSSNKLTEDGVSHSMQTNHFGPFLLTNLLLPLLESSAPSRIINVSSMIYRYGEIDFENFEKVSDEAFGSLSVYSTSKLCNVLMTTVLEKKLRGTGVTANCLHPGAVKTGIFPVLPVFQLITPLFNLFIKTPWEGAQTTIRLAVAPELCDVSGLYFTDCHVSKLTRKAEDAELARKVWEVSERVVKLK